MQGAEIVLRNRVLETNPRSDGSWEVVTEQGTIVAEQLVNFQLAVGQRLNEACLIGGRGSSRSQVEAMQISSNAVAVRLHRALGRLRDAVHDQAEIEK